MAVARTNATHTDPAEDTTKTNTTQTATNDQAATSATATSATATGATAADATSTQDQANASAADSTTGGGTSVDSANANTGATQDTPDTTSQSAADTSASETAAANASETSAASPGSEASAASPGDQAASETGASGPEAGEDSAAGTGDSADAGNAGEQPPADGQDSVGDAQPSEQVYVADLDALNNSGVDGFAIISTEADGSVTVNVVAEGLEADQEHAQQIHGFADGKESADPTIAQDADGDGFVESSEGEASYGPSLFDLTAGSDDEGAESDDAVASADGATSDDDASQSGGDSAAQVDSASADAGTVETPSATDGEDLFSETHSFTGEEATALLEKLGQIDSNEFVLYGQSVGEGAGSDTEGEVDGTAGYKDTLPVASGDLQAVSGETAEVALSLLDSIGDDPSGAELSGTFHVVQALEAFIAAREDGSVSDGAGGGSTSEVADGTDGAGGETVASDESAQTPPAQVADSGQASSSTGGQAPSSTDGDSDTAANDNSDDLNVASNDHQGDMMFA